MYKRVQAFWAVFALFLLWMLPITSQAQCSQSSTNSPTTIFFVNHTTGTVNVFWVNFECNEQQYSSLPAGDSVEQPTYEGHEWVARDSAGNEVGRVVAEKNDLTLTIGAEVIEAPESPLDFDYQPAGEFEIVEGYDGCVVGDVPNGLGLDPFYVKYCDYDGIPIVSSADVPDLALQAAWNIMANMLQGQTDLIEAMHSVDLRIGIVAQSEGITELPEYHFLKDDSETNWDERARGLGGNPGVPLGSGAEENLLCYDDDPYRGESIFLHEFAHTLKDTGLALVDPKFNPALQLAYEAAQANGLWENTYALSTVEEYWAEGVQDYFNTNFEAIPTDGIHNEVNTREELKAYDPTLYAIIDRVFNGLEWTPVCPS